MTELHKIVKRRTVNDVRLARRRVVVMLMPGDILGFKDDRRRTVYTLPIEQAYSIAVRNYADKERARRKADKQRKKELRGVTL